MVHSRSVLTAVIAVGVASSVLAIPVPPASTNTGGPNNGVTPTPSNLLVSGQNVMPSYASNSPSPNVNFVLGQSSSNDSQAQGSPIPAGNVKRALERESRYLDITVQDNVDSEEPNEGLTTSTVRREILERGPDFNIETAMEELASTKYDWSKFLENTQQGQMIKKMDNDSQNNWKTYFLSVKTSRERPTNSRASGAPQSTAGPGSQSHNYENLGDKDLALLLIIMSRTWIELIALVLLSHDPLNLPSTASKIASFGVAMDNVIML
ncbi:hypothetical protein LENED_002045 [Lentinula edodes]|uniref:RxLR effector protein n=1 Tax=Lentinula edodes TaxID=5353 RepID=A0A1Q3DZT0_LENED|nr:hypothetical protein LENED_002045 [Lentinula edodes]